MADFSIIENVQLFDPYYGHEIVVGAPYTPTDSDVPKGAVPLTLEYFGEHGYIVCPIHAVLSEKIKALPEVEQGGLTGAKIFEQEFGIWQLQIQGTNGECTEILKPEQEELFELFERDNIFLHCRKTQEALVEEEKTLEEEKAEVEEKIENPNAFESFKISTSTEILPAQQSETEQWEETPPPSDFDAPPLMDFDAPPF